MRGNLKIKHGFAYIAAIEGALEKLKQDIASIISTLAKFPNPDEIKQDIEKNKREIEELTDFANKNFEETKEAIQDSTNGLMVELKVEFQKMREELEEIPSYQRRNNLEINGVPEVKNENLYEVIARLGAVLNVSIDYRHIDTIHRVPTRRTGEPKPIIVRFFNRWLRDQLYRARKEKKDICAADIGIGTRSVGAKEGDKKKERVDPIFINEHLTPHNQAIFKRARHLKASKFYKYAWTNGGKVFLRKTEESSPIRVTNTLLMENLEKGCGVSVSE